MNVNDIVSDIGTGGRGGDFFRTQFFVLSHTPGDLLACCRRLQRRFSKYNTETFILFQYIVCVFACYRNTYNNNKVPYFINKSIPSGVHYVYNVYTVAYFAYSLFRRYGHNNNNNNKISITIFYSVFYV